MNEAVDQRVNMVTHSYEGAIPSLQHNSVEPQHCATHTEFCKYYRSNVQR